MDKSKKPIAIIGGGVSGTYAAYALNRLGYKNLTIYEKSDTTTHTAKSKKIDGNFVDFATKFIPSTNLKGDESVNKLYELIADLGFTRVEAAKIYLWDTETNKEAKSPEALSEFGKLRLLKEILIGFSEVTAISNCSSIEEVIKKGLVNDGETLEEWGKRKNLVAFAKYTAYQSDLMSCGPSLGDNAAFILLSRCHFVGGDYWDITERHPIVKMLVKSKFISELLGINNHAELNSFFSSNKKLNTTRYIIEEGYEAFFKAMLNKSKAIVLTDTPACEIQINNNIVTISARSNDIKNYDHVIFACPPSAFNNIKNNFIPASLIHPNPKNRIVRSKMIRVDEWKENSKPSKGILLNNKNNLLMASHQMRVTGEVYAGCKENKQSNVVTFPIYVCDEEKDYEKLFNNSLEIFGLRNSESIDHKDFDFPRPLVYENYTSSFYSDLRSIEHKFPVSFVGEYLAGTGVPAAINQVDEAMMKLR